MKFSVVAALFTAAIAAPTPRDDPLATILGLTSGLQTTAVGPLTDLTGLDINVNDLTDVQTTLTTVTTQVQGVSNQVLPMALGLTGNLGAGDLAAVTDVVGQVQVVVSGVTLGLTTLTGPLDADVLAQLKPQIAGLVAVTSQLTAPILSLAFGLAGPVGTSGVDTTALLGSVGGLTTTVQTLVSPTGVLGGLLLNVPVAGGLVGGVLGAVGGVTGGIL